VYALTELNPDYMPALPPESDLFDALRANWQYDNAAPAVDIARLREAAETELRKQHRRHLRATLFMSASFVAAIGVTSWIYLRFDDHGPLFYGSIIAVNLLMILMGVLMWLGVQRDKSSAGLNSREHLAQELKKLNYRRFTLLYALPAYMVILAVALICYYVDVLERASMLFKVLTYAGTMVYCGGVWLLSRRKTKKKLHDTTRLINELQQLKMALEKPE
jgi:archaellum biogenesis protein FlaJ (TadC family)